MPSLTRSRRNQRCRGRYRDRDRAAQAIPTPIPTPIPIHQIKCDGPPGCDPPICRMARRSVFNPRQTPQRRLTLTGFALLPEEETRCIVPPGTVDSSPPFQRWDKPRSIVPPSPGGTTETLSEDVFQPSLRDWIWKKGRVFPPLKCWAIVRCPSGT